MRRIHDIANLVAGMISLTGGVRLLAEGLEGSDWLNGAGTQTKLCLLGIWFLLLGVAGVASHPRVRDLLRRYVDDLRHPFDIWR